ncbi:hypothetical protein AK88_02520 [Plasmodium fragile]|uniref:Pv-fam-h protein n=1 Tax=Plasmodium fragile TaxID=5857 RepID=A0A0D9QL70_PLAFR|nr:uncharacterized protein AK88_02520 [Plasmodium fragile]KJP87764.1 hypothetical protein AK88_02520 [Plasmodium fragile]
MDEDVSCISSPSHLNVPNYIQNTDHRVIEGTPQQGQASVHKNTNRLLAEGRMDFDEVYGTFKKQVLEKLGCDEEQCTAVKNSVKSYFDKIKWNVKDQQGAEKSGERSKALECASEKGKEGSDSYKYTGALGSLIHLVLNYKLTSLTILILALAYFKSRYLFVVMGIVILLNIFWELESLNKKLKNP